MQNAIKAVMPTMNLAQQNVHLPRTVAFELANRAHRCVQWLKDQGFEVLHVQQGLRNPRVIIRTCMLCNQLDGAVLMYERLDQSLRRSERRYWMVLRHNCEVRWADHLTDQGGAL